MYGYIYESLNKINGKKYIGKKVSPIFVKKYFGSGIALMKAVKKYGIENFEVRIISTADSREELEEKEIFYIKKFNCVKSQNYYNISSGGTGFGCGESNHMKKEEYKKLYAIKFGGKNNPMYKSGERGIHPRGMLGKHHTEETILRIKKNVSGKRNGCQKGFWSKKGRTHPRGMLGKNHQNTKWKTSIRVEIILPGKEPRVFETISDASRELNIPRNIISKCVSTNKPYKNPQNFKDYYIYNDIICRKIEDNTEVS